jgi:hypothetical protein
MYERAQLRNSTGEDREFDLWTTCFTARELEQSPHSPSAKGIL